MRKNILVSESLPVSYSAKKITIDKNSPKLFSHAKKSQESSGVQKGSQAIDSEFFCYLRKIFWSVSLELLEKKQTISFNFAVRSALNNNKQKALQAR